ncbi:MAG: hypothetical protein QGH76_09415 [Phycisphaerales bacterium]|nr:hypothetical protein [Phycisphaerales bacterium]
MKLIHIVVGAGVISLPLWAFAITRGQGETWSWVMAVGDQVCSSDDTDACAWNHGSSMYGSLSGPTFNLFADFDLDGDADWLIAGLAPVEENDGYGVETFDLTLRLVLGNGTGMWDVGQAEVVGSMQCRQDLEEIGKFGDVFVYDPNTVYIEFPDIDDMNGQGSDSDGPVFHVQDVNGDTYPDLILEGFTYTITEEDDEWGWTIQFIDRYNAMYTFLNTGGTGFRCAGDVDGDGHTKLPDLLDLLEDWGCNTGE